MSQARAADDGSAVDADDDAPLPALGEQLAAKRRDAGERLRGLVQHAFEHTVQRLHETRREVEQVITFGYGLEGLASLDFSTPAANDEDSGREASKPSRRLEYVEGTNDPLAGL